MTTILKYQRMHTLLNEKQWRQYLATEAEERGNAAAVAREAGVSINTIARGRRDIEAGDLYRPGNRIRAKGAGPKRISVIDPTLIDDLESIVEPKGDPMSLIRWTTKSLQHLVQALEEKGHYIKKSALANLMGTLEFSLKANKKNIEGCRILTATSSSTTSNKPAKLSNGEAIRLSPSIARRRNSSAISRTTAGSGSRRGKHHCQRVRLHQPGRGQGGSVRRL